MRGYIQQFGKRSRIARCIEELSAQLEAMEYPTGPSRFYGLEVALCLRGGALLGATIVASALLEAYVRGLIILYAQEAQDGFAIDINPERDLEWMRSKRFEDLLNHLVACNLFRTEDVSEALEIYRDIRIPAHHGLSWRLLKRDEMLATLDELFPDERSHSGRPTTLHEIESYVETNALPVIERIVGVLERNGPNENR